MPKVFQKYTKCRTNYFTHEALLSARNRLKQQGLFHEDIATQVGSIVSVVRKVLYGYLSARRSGCHRVAVTLGFKKAILADSNFRSTENVSPQKTDLEATTADFFGQTDRIRQNENRNFGAVSACNVGHRTSCDTCRLCFVASRAGMR